MKITGAPTLDCSVEDEAVSEGLVHAVDVTAGGSNGSGDETGDESDGAAPDSDWSIEEGAFEVISDEEEQVLDLQSTQEDREFLDLLVDTLDGDFDPELLV